MAWRLKGSLLFRRRALTRPRGKRGLAAEIRVLPFHDYKRRLMASPGAMAIPDRRGSAVLIGLPQKQMHDGAPTRDRLELDKPQRGREFLFSRAASARR